MGRKRGRSRSHKKGGGGVLRGMRGGFQSAVKGATGVGEDEGKKQSAFARWFWNIVTGVLLIVALAVFLRRCGIVTF